MLPLDLEYAHEKLTNPKGSMLCFKGGTKIYLRKENNQRLSGVTKFTATNLNFLLLTQIPIYL